ncbi:3-hydroxyacyl- dehydrogenase [Lasiodiplodia theobromae]|uniref:3-hydroxyacyl- dehydrogenase n=1 Tax=Lasiodiplodia theobromae TaxID=45133 RepID=UPI0015C34998|nr:3-hydroxyacyl- dehydrogenase [Lasiodiplodia theobromae]KAF4540962.1 3-hydroxyacyl- dehydrogenase [Lasiodiplodia theobromae]
MSGTHYIDADTRITLIGAGTIGLSFAALHLHFLKSPSQLTILDTRPDLAEYVASTLPKYLPEGQYDLSSIRLTDSLPDAVRDADIVQEQGPENLPFKAAIWAQVAEHVEKPGALFWSSTSGITATAQAEAAGLVDAAARLVVVHPYNPPHIMPLLEVVPGARTSEETVRRTVTFWQARGREPVVLHKEVSGFVANRLAFALLREAVHLVRDGVVGVEELDRVVQASMGPRWAVAGPFKSYHAGGGPGGLEAFFKNIGGTVQRCWDDSGRENVGDGWEDDIFKQAEDAYGVVDTSRRDRVTREVLEAARKK